jgi:hypothetical protein
MKNSINGAVLALLLAFAAPAPVAETLTGQEQESLLVLTRPSRSVARTASLPEDHPRAAPVEPSQARPIPDTPDPRVHLPADGIPPILSRPPPL